MKRRLTNIGSILIITIFTIAMLSTLVIGILEVNAEEIQLMQSQVYAAQALALAEAGLNKAFAEIRNDRDWRMAMPTLVELNEWGDMWKYGHIPPGGEEVEDGFYKVGYDGSTVLVTAGVRSWYGYTATLQAQITVSEQYPHIIRVDNLKVNEYYQE